MFKIKILGFLYFEIATIGCKRFKLKPFIVFLMKFFLVRVSFVQCFQPFKRWPHKMVKHTQTIRWQFAKELFECVWPYCGVGA